MLYCCGCFCEISVYQLLSLPSCKRNLCYTWLALTIFCCCLHLFCSSAKANSSTLSLWLFVSARHLFCSKVSLLRLSSGFSPYAFIYCCACCLSLFTQLPSILLIFCWCTISYCHCVACFAFVLFTVRMHITFSFFILLLFYDLMNEWVKLKKSLKIHSHPFLFFK